MGYQYAEQLKGLREVTRNRKLATALTATCVTLWSLTAIYWFLVEPPIVYDATQAIIEPSTLKPGEEFRVRRTFEAKRDAHIFISRYLIQGDCKRTCEIVDVSQGYSWITKGHHNRWREHVLPGRTEPGRWTFQVIVQWQDRFGFSHTLRLAPLEITVIPR